MSAAVVIAESASQALCSDLISTGSTANVANMHKKIVRTVKPSSAEMPANPCLATTEEKPQRALKLFRIS